MLLRLQPARYVIMSNSSLPAASLGLYCSYAARIENQETQRQNRTTMAIVIEHDQSVHDDSAGQFGLECPYCGVYSHMTPQSIPAVETVIRLRPKHVGLVYQCDACRAPVFLRLAVKGYGEHKIELFRNFVE